MFNIPAAFSVGGPEDDSRDHLFFRCSWAQMLIDVVIQRLGIAFRPITLEDMFTKLLRLKCDKEKKMLLAAVYNAITYYLWIYRCKKFHGELKWNVAQVV